MVRCCSLVCAIGVLFGGIEIGLVYALKVRFLLPKPAISITTNLSLVRSLPRKTLAHEFNGHHLHHPLISRRSAPLLGYIHPPHRPRHLIHLRWYRCRRRYILTHLCVYATPSRSLFSQFPIEYRELTYRKVFQPELDILGIVIYATEFLLWCGVFACGGYFNFLPWMRRRLRSKREGERANGEGNGDGEDRGVTNAVQLHQVGSSTSVFRTSGSLLVGGGSARSDNGG